MNSSLTKKNKIKYAGVALFFLAFFIASYFQFRISDAHINYNIANPALELTQEAENYLADNDDITKEMLLNGESQFEGFLLQSSYFILNATEYNIKTEYAYSGNENAIMFIIDDNMLNDDGNAGVEITSIELSPDSTNTENIFSANYYTTNAVAKIYVPQGGVVNIYESAFTSTSVFYNDALLKALFLTDLLAAALFLIFNMKEKEKHKKFLVNICICYLIGAAVSVPFLNYDLLRSHDIMFHLGRIESAFLAISGGDIPFRMNTFVHHNFGYTDPIYYPNLFIYFPGLLRALNISLSTAYKAMYIAINIATALIAFYSAHKLTKSRKCAIIFTMFYTFSVYRLINVHTRGAMGEALAMIFIPLAFYALHAILFKEKKPWVTLAVAMTCIIASHVLSVLLVCGILLLYCIYNYKKVLIKNTIFAFLKAIGLTTALSAWWAVPFIAYSQYPTIAYNEAYDLSAHGVQFSQLFSLFSLNAASISMPYSDGVSNEMPLTIGVLCAIGVLFYVFRRFYSKCPELCNNKQMLSIGNFSLVLFVLTIFASTTSAPYNLISQIPILSFISVIQLPFRFLAYSTLFACVLTALAFVPLIKKNIISNNIIFIIVFLPVLFSMPYTDSLSQDIGIKDIGPNAVVAGTGDFLYFESVNVLDSTIPQNSALYCEDESVVFSNAQRNPDNLTEITFSFDNTSGNEQIIRVPLYCHPNAYAQLENYGEIEVQSSDYDEYFVVIPKGVTSGTITVGFKYPWYFKASEIVSFISFVLFIGFLAFRKKLAK